jgi:hypothetical protein
MTDVGMKLLALPIVIKTSGALGFMGTGRARGLGVVLLVCTLFYAVPQTAMLGAILLTDNLGGAVATHVRVGSPLFTHILFGRLSGAATLGRALSPGRQIARVNSVSYSLSAAG